MRCASVTSVAYWLKAVYAGVGHSGQAQELEPFHTQRLTKQGAVVEVTVTATALRNEAGDVYAIATTERLIAGGADD